MKFIKTILLTTISISMILCSCCGKREAENTAETTEFRANATVSDSYAYRVDNERLNIWDLSNNRYDIFCSQPNCKHKTLADDPNSRCLAVAPDKEQEIKYAFIYENSLYMICSGNLNETLIYKSDKDGQNRKPYMTVKISLCSLTNPTFLNGVLVFVGSEYNTDGKANLQEHYSICAINLNSKEFENYGEIGKANESLVGRNSLHICKDRIYFLQCEYTENSQNNEIKYIDINDTAKSGKTLLASSEPLNVWQYTDDKIIYVVAENGDTHSKVCTLGLDNSKQEQLFERDGYISDVYLSGEKCFYFFSKTEGENEVRGAAVYDMNSHKTTEYQFAENEWLSVLGHTKNGFLLYSQKGENEVMELCQDDDFWTLNFENSKKAATGSDVQ